MRQKQITWMTTGMIILLAACIGCSSGEKDKQSDVSATTAAKTDKASVKKTVTPDTMLSVSHILVAYKGAQRAPEGVTRTKEEALARANKALQSVKKGAVFGSVAMGYSDCPSGPSGGDLGLFPASRNSKEFTDAIVALEIGQISDVVETGYGYHIMKRQKVEKSWSAHARHILIQHDEASGLPNKVYADGKGVKGIGRTKEEAKKLAEEVLAKLKAGADFEALVTEFSDCTTKEKGGYLGVYGNTDRENPIGKHVFFLENLEFTDVVETPYGYHIVQRIAQVPEAAKAAKQAAPAAIPATAQ